MDTRNNPKIERAIQSVQEFAPRVLLADCYEGYELRKLRDALVYLLDETYKK